MRTAGGALRFALWLCPSIDMYPHSSRTSLVQVERRSRRRSQQGGTYTTTQRLAARHTAAEMLTGRTCPG